MSDKARIARRSPADRLFRRVVIGGPPLVGLALACQFGWLDISPSPDDAPVPAVSPASPDTLRCLGLEAIHGDDGNLRVTPRIEGPIPEGSTMSYVVVYDGQPTPSLTAPLGTVVAPGHPDEVRASLVPGGEPQPPVVCEPWTN